TDAVSYGADNTGATDSTAAINAALTAAGPIGIVYLHSGVYRVSGTIPLGYGQTLLGAGHYETWVYTTAPTGDVFTLNTGSTINGLTASVITIDDLWIMNMYNGLRLTGVDVLFTNSWVYNVVNYSVVVAGTNSAPFLDNVTLAWSTGNKPLAHMEVQACGNLVMVDCQCVQGTYGMDISPTGSGVF